MFLTTCRSLKYLDWCVSPVLSSVHILQVSSLPPVRFWRRKTVTMKVLICVRCVSPLAGDTSLSRASHSLVTSLPSVPRLRHSGKSYGCVWCVSPALEAGNPGVLGSSQRPVPQVTRLGLAAHGLVNKLLVDHSRWGRSCIRSVSR